MDLGPTGAGRSERQRGDTSHPLTERTPKSASKLFIVREIVNLVRNDCFLCVVLENPG